MERSDLADLYRRYGLLVCRRCRFILRNEEEARDAMQEVFVRVAKYGDRILAAENRLAFLYRVAERHCFDRLRKRQRERVALLAREEIIRASFPDGAPTEAVREVVDLIQGLDDKLKQLALAYYVDDLTQAQVAAQLGWSRRTVGKKLKQLSAQLRSQLMAEETSDESS